MLVFQHFQLPLHFILHKNGGSKVKVAYCCLVIYELHWDIFVFGQSGHIDKKKPFLWMLMRQTERRGVNIYWMIAHSLAPLNVCFFGFCIEPICTLVTIIGSRSWMRDILIRDMANCHWQFWGISICLCNCFVARPLLQGRSYL